MNGYIYKITNTINNKIYVGMAKDVDVRWKYGHLASANKLISGIPLKYKSLLYDAMKKYGVDNFKIEVIEECPIENMGEREEFWIDKLNSRDPNVGYNICKGGSRGPGGPMFAGHHHSPETIAKMKQDRTGEGNANYGNRWAQSDELKKKHSEISSGGGNGMYGKHHSDASNDKNRSSHIGRKRMSNASIYPDYKMIPQDEIEYYLSLGWFLLKP